MLITFGSPSKVFHVLCRSWIFLKTLLKIMTSQSIISSLQQESSGLNVNSPSLWASSGQRYGKYFIFCSVSENLYNTFGCTEGLSLLSRGYSHFIHAVHLWSISCQVEGLFCWPCFYLPTCRTFFHYLYEASGCLYHLSHGGVRPPVAGHITQTLPVHRKIVQILHMCRWIHFEARHTEYRCGSVNTLYSECI